MNNSIDNYGLLLIIKKSLDSSREAIAICDPNGKLIYVNPMHEQLFGRSFDEATTLNYRDYYPPESIEVIDGIVASALARGDGWEGELDVIDKSGRRFTLWERADAVRDSDGRLIYSIRLMHDISSWHKAQRDLQINQYHLKQAQKLASIGSFRCNLTSKECWFSEQLQTILFNRNDLLGYYNIDMLKASVHIDDQEIWDNAFSKLLSQIHQTVELEHRVVRPDQAIRYVITRISPLRNTANEIEELSGTIQDITDRKLQEEEQKLFEQQLRQMQKLESLGVLAGGIAHDFNNLLMTILGNTDLALNYLPHHSPAHKHLQEIDQATQRAAELTKQMLAYSGKGRIFIEPLNMNDLIHHTTDILASSVSKKISIKFNLDSNISLVDADSSQLRQVLLNLVINAAESIGESTGSITIKTGEMLLSTKQLPPALVFVPPVDGAYVYIQVTDTGCGMDDELLTKIFDPFFTTKFTGRGLGLAAVLGIVRSHSGTISITSDKRKGSEFTAFFPASSKIEESKIDSKQTSSSSHKHSKVLVVDDDSGVRSVATEMLRLLGYDVIQAEDGVAAIDLFKRDKHIATTVILDYSMPQLNGEETFRELRKLSPSLKVFLSSGFSEREATEQFQSLELAGFLHKPYKLSELKEKLSALES